MNIGIISHPPAWTTGFGITTSRIALGLSKAGHRVTCLGLGFGIVEDEKLDEQYPFMIWKSSRRQGNFDKISDFLKDGGFDVILVNFDIAAAAYVIKICKVQNFKKIFAHIVLDGFPASANLLHDIDGIAGIIVPTKISQKYLRSAGINSVYFAPHGVDLNQFFPIDKKAIRKKLNLKKTKPSFIVGLFAKNDERKQIPKVFMALHYLIFNFKQKDIFLYVHSEIEPVAGKGWNLKSLAGFLNITGNVIFTEKSFIPEVGVKQQSDTNESLSYLERMNMCDVIVNVPFSGGFELCNIEAQACGIPLITINDDGNIKEVVGNSALMIEPKIKNIWNNGCVIYLIDEIDLAETILQLKNDAALVRSMQQKGFENIKRFPWTYLEKAVLKMLGGYKH